LTEKCRPWFFGDVTAEEAELLLQGQSVGTFLIRFSQHKGNLAASYVGPKEGVKASEDLPFELCKIQKGLITKHPSGWQVGGAGMVFPSVDDLIAHYVEQGIFTQPFMQ
jgi:hypothetical protein